MKLKKSYLDKAKDKNITFTVNGMVMYYDQSTGSDMGAKVIQALALLKVNKYPSESETVCYNTNTIYEHCLSKYAAFASFCDRNPSSFNYVTRVLIQIYMYLLNIHSMAIAQAVQKQ
ncbi:hypothetical protein CYY_006843 [Polysphondylium violaceum]|uniref:Uncharacterized protein n=1 Tax=Polysphondylium violaceum TaxID=133409 RepID=A0A8J4UR99_9MYCE|nr:hypothetical protein CYY_006843 [Polysphondylium violaceum]